MLSVDVQPLDWTTWSHCPKNCWRNDEERPRRYRTQNYNVKGGTEIYNWEFKECGDPCGFGKFNRKFPRTSNDPFKIRRGLF